MIHAETGPAGQRAKFRETVESLDEGYFSVTLDGILLDHNPAYCRVLRDPRGRRTFAGSLTPDFWAVATDRDDYVTGLLADGHVHDFLGGSAGPKTDGPSRRPDRRPRRDSTNRR